jgi:hypothetical protein
MHPTNYPVKGLRVKARGTYEGVRLRNSHYILVCLESCVKLSNKIKSKLDGGLDADKHIQKVVGESPRVWQKPLLSLGPVHPRARTIL